VLAELLETEDEVVDGRLEFGRIVGSEKEVPNMLRIWCEVDE
jgi:hypothetical protein